MRCPSSDAAFALLHAAGWSIGDCCIIASTGVRWIVTGTNGEHSLRVEGPTQAEAWALAVEQARKLGQ